MAAERIALRAETMESAIARAAEALRDGGVAVLPAEGVYGYHALASNADGVERLRALKSRGEAKGWIGLVARPADAYRWVSAVPARAAGWIQEYWPGALTLVFPAGPSLPPALIGPGKTVALRCPGSEFLRGVILATGGILISTSANPPGEPAATRAPTAEETPREIALVVDAGSVSGESSTVVLVDGEEITILRQGAVRLSGTTLDAPSVGP